MKVIDLLNKIANGEETKPIDYNGENTLTYYLYEKCGEECDDTNLVNILNDEVKIMDIYKIEELRDFIIKNMGLYTRNLSNQELKEKYVNDLNYIVKSMDNIKIGE